MGAGKTTIGGHLAAHYSLPFIDCDAEISAEEKMSISEIFATKGEAYFRDKETQLLRTLKSKSPHIISTGGGMVLSKANQAYLTQMGYIIYLHANFDAIRSRLLIGKNNRPLFNQQDPSELQSMYLKRLPLYRHLASIEFDTTATTIVSTLKTIYTHLKENT